MQAHMLSVRMRLPCGPCLCSLRRSLAWPSAPATPTCSPAAWTRWSSAGTWSRTRCADMEQNKVRRHGAEQGAHGAEQGAHGAEQGAQTWSRTRCADMEQNEVRRHGAERGAQTWSRTRCAGMEQNKVCRHGAEQGAQAWSRTRCADMEQNKVRRHGAERGAGTWSRTRCAARPAPALERWRSRGQGAWIGGGPHAQHCLRPWLFLGLLLINMLTPVRVDINRNHLWAVEYMRATRSRGVERGRACSAVRSCCSKAWSGQKCNLCCVEAWVGQKRSLSCGKAWSGLKCRLCCGKAWSRKQRLHQQEWPAGLAFVRDGAEAIWQHVQRIQASSHIQAIPAFMN